MTAAFQCLIGLECEDFTMIASDQTCMRTIYILKDDEDKIVQLSNNTIMGANGDCGDIAQFSQFIESNFTLYEIKNGYQLDTKAVAHFVRNSLVETITSSKIPKIMNFMIGGWDKTNGGQLYRLDAPGTCTKVPYGSSNIAGMFCMSILEYYHKRDMTESQAYEVVQMCVKEIHKRVFVNLSNFIVKVVSKTGISTLPVISSPRIIPAPPLNICCTGLKIGSPMEDEKKRSDSDSDKNDEVEKQKR